MKFTNVDDSGGAESILYLASMKLVKRKAMSIL